MSGHYSCYLCAMYTCRADNIVSNELKLLFAVVVDGSLRVSPGLLLYGNDVLQRSNVLERSARRTWIDANHRLVSGFLSRYYLYANAADRPSFTRIQIWRPAGGVQSSDTPMYTLVWERRVFFNTTRYGLLYTVGLIMHNKKSCSSFSRPGQDCIGCFWVILLWGG